ncbi:MAG: TonB-dependent receptor [Saprospiraceae bacterium]|nr:TonB-dependent receptor [Saprospiraceae bacterium]
MKYFIGSIMLLCTVISGYSQTLKGTLQSYSGDKIDHAEIKWLGDVIGTYTEEDGTYELERSKVSDKLLISAIGFYSDTVEVEAGLTQFDIKMTPIRQLTEVTVSSKRQDSYVSTLQTKNVETLTAHELKNAPCCSLSESFETNATVDVVQTDAVTGTKEIQMLGLKGIYTQVLLENKPDFGGIGSAYAMDFVPGTWIDAIQISKGASTVVNGYQSITGQINVELIKPNKGKPLYINAYGNHEGRYEANVVLNKKYKSPWSQGLLMHASGQQNRSDHDHDSFIENVLRSTYSGVYRLFYTGDIWDVQLNFTGAYDDRKSGQYAHKHILDDSEGLYHINQTNKRFEVFGKAAFLGMKGEKESFGFQWHAIHHDLNNFIGYRSLLANETDLLANLLYKNRIGNNNNTIEFGLNGQIDNIKQNYENMPLNYNDRTAGLHAEYAYSNKDAHSTASAFMKNFGIVAGIRLDNHSQQGWFVVPRVNVKYNFTDETILRFSAGRGLRRALPFTDYINRMANNRTWVVQANLPLEDAWNIGGNFTQSFTLKERNGQIALDAYQVLFNQQVIIDMDESAKNVYIYALDGKSQSTTIQVSGQYEIFAGMNLKAAYKYSGVKLDYLEGYRDAVFVPKDRWLFTAAYKTPNQKWMFNLLANYTGKMRLPDTDGIPESVLGLNKEESNPFWRFDFQTTYFAKNFEIYSGIENFMDYRQKSPILDHHNPFGEYFDAGRVYAPLNGRMFSLGVRYWLDSPQTK